MKRRILSPQWLLKAAMFTLLGAVSVAVLDRHDALSDDRTSSVTKETRELSEHDDAADSFGLVDHHVTLILAIASKNG